MSFWRSGAAPAVALTAAALLPAHTPPAAARPAVTPVIQRAAGGEAPGAPGAAADWTPADKDGVGTARSAASRLWFTLGDGQLQEVFYPDLSTPSVRSMELLVTDGRSFTDRESTDTVHRTRRVDDRGLTYQQVDTARSGRYRITKTYVADPDRSTVLVDVRFQPLRGGPYRVYLQYDPSLGNGGMDDSGRTVGDALVAADGSVASALLAAPALGAASSGYLGVSDGWTDLATDHRLDRRFASAARGNVVQVAELPGLARTGRTTVALGFGATAAGALATARGSLRGGFGRAAGDYAAGWHRYLAGLRPVPASVRHSPAQYAEYLVSVLMLAAAEDKANPGAVVASPTEPWAWGQEVPGLSSPSGAYHLVWARDAYQIGTGLLAAGDTAAAARIVRWLFGRQQRPDGSFPQNSAVDGSPVWTNLQLDEVALPIVLAWQVAQASGRQPAAADYAGVRRAADFLLGFRDPGTGRAAPFSPQERWENQSGYSPATIAAEVAGLVCAADLARRRGHPADAARWLATADAWRLSIPKWTVTRTGPYSSRPYYLRLTKDGDPDAGTTYSLGDGGPSAIDQRAVVDPSFLDLVRLGVTPATDPTVRATLPVVDAQLAARTPRGTFWHRYTADGYGEDRSGGPWRPTDPDTAITLGRVWPLLAGERGEYELAAGRSGRPALIALAATANAGGMLAEQVWDGRPPTGQAGFAAGTGTFSATPLLWSHAVFVRLAASIDAGRPVERPAVVYCRYAARC
ncbi:MAG: glucoamylase [Mycobacteriales bacterium]